MSPISGISVDRRSAMNLQDVGEPGASAAASHGREPAAERRRSYDGSMTEVRSAVLSPDERECRGTCLYGPTTTFATLSATPAYNAETGSAPADRSPKVG